MKKKILIVEDDPDLVYVLQRLMGLLGHDTIAAKTGKEAVKIAASKLPDLIILDIMIPEMDGFEVSRKIRENLATQGIPIIAVTALTAFKDPIIAVTALTAFKDKQKCFQSGCNEYIPKPLIPTKLASSVEKMLNSPPAEELGK